MLGKDIRFGHEARKKILEGIIAAENTVASTLGPKGKTVLIDKGTGHPYYTKDGQHVLQAVMFSDNWKNLGALLVRNTSIRSNREAGDGSTTVSLLFSELCKAGAALVDRGIDQNEVAKAYKAAAADMIEAIQKYKKTVSSDDDILNIATISANNDSEIGNYVLEAFQGIGEDGVVSIKDSYNGKTEITFSEGYKVPQGFLNGDYATDIENEVCEFTDGAIIIYNEDLKDQETLKPVLNWAYNNKKPIVIFANSVSSEINNFIISNVKNNIIKACVIKAGSQTKAERLERYKDIAAYFGIEILGTNDRPANAFDSSKCIGLYKGVQVTPQYTLFADPVCNENTLQVRVNDLKSLLEDATTATLSLSEKEKEGLKERIAALTGGIATIYVGGDDMPEIKEKIDRYEDALNAVRAAVSEGITPGGGVTLLKASYDCGKIKHKKESNDFIVGYNTFLQVCRKPIKFILANLMESEDIEYTIAKIAANKSKSAGYDAKSNKYVKDMFARGIIDPIKVEECALRYSSSAAALFLTSDAVITDEQNNLSVEPTDPIMDKYKD